MGRRAAQLTLLALLAFGACGLFASGVRPAGAAQSGVPLTVITDASLPGRATRFDYQAIDQTTRRLYVAHLGDSTLEVVDLDTSRVVATVGGLSDVHGVTVAPDRDRVYATATGANELVAIDAPTNRVITRVRTGRFPDGVAYDAGDGLVLVSNKKDGSITMIDAATNSRVDTIELGDETGNVAYDPTTLLVYAAVHKPDALVAIDPRTRQIARRIPLARCDGAHGIYLDPATQRAFIACEHNASLVTVDLRAGRATANQSVGADPDVLAFDSGLRRLYVASESGIVSVFDTSNATPRKMGQAQLAGHAHTVAVDQVTHRVYFPLQSVDGQPVLRVTAPTRSAP